MNSSEPVVIQMEKMRPRKGQGLTLAIQLPLTDRLPDNQLLQVSQAMCLGLYQSPFCSGPKKTAERDLQDSCSGSPHGTSIPWAFPPSQIF